MLVYQRVFCLCQNMSKNMVLLQIVWEKAIHWWTSCGSKTRNEWHEFLGHSETNTAGYSRAAEARFCFFPFIQVFGHWWGKLCDKHGSPHVWKHTFIVSVYCIQMKHDETKVFTSIPPMAGHIQIALVHLGLWRMSLEGPHDALCHLFWKGTFEKTAGHLDPSNWGDKLCFMQACTMESVAGSMGKQKPDWACIYIYINMIIYVSVQYNFNNGLYRMYM